jgi:fused signal recognition particle receptor
VSTPAPVHVPTPAAAPMQPPAPAPAPALVSVQAPAPAPVVSPVAAPVPEATSAPLDFLKRMFTGAPEPVAPPPEPVAAPAAVEEAPREAWFQRLRKGLARTGSGIAQVFTGARIDDELYEELESALLMADAGVRATEHLLKDLKQRVKAAGSTEPSQVKGLLADAIVDLLAPLERSLMVGEHEPTVIMVAGVNGAGKTTSIGKLTKHLAEAKCKVLLAAADTFRAAAREQLEVWADRNQVEIVSQEGGDPASVTFDAVKAGKARGCDVVIADTAGRLPTQLHLMEELKKIKRVIAKADAGAPHEVLLVIDGNTGQNALEQVKSFDAALELTGLIVTKLDGTAKGGVLAAIALWSRDRAAQAGKKVIPVYFIGVGEKLEDLQTFNAREFASALLN